MFPMITQEIVRAEQAHRLEGFRRWSRRHAVGAPYAEAAQVAEVTDVVTADAPRRHRSTVRPVLGR